ncbi:Zinc finger CCCH domain-containing protein 49 [Carex littledalei]|uniref:Zinc finger CCCH domain-containing protein 49 n=1 Tax=Carex littledalei TaxID=544730 RepID=A0A833VIT3_9POAL|nr:Zinc finger CCCH domain-containing protein 49 [Carex littledalei]
MSNLSPNRLYQATPYACPIAMPLYDCNSEHLVQRIPWMELQNSVAMMRYYAELMLRYERRSYESKPLKEVDSGIGMADAHSDDDFMMYHFKVQLCSTSRGHHDWTDCQYLHPGEKARRRDPRTYSYTGKPCADFRKRGQCENGDRCQFAHGVFETWLHPDKYKTQMCRDQGNCQRKVCFFAHSEMELRDGDGVKEEKSDAISPKSVLSMNQSLPQFRTDNNDTKILERWREEREVIGVQNIANGALGQDSNCNIDINNLNETFEELNVDWVDELLN